MIWQILCSCVSALNSACRTVGRSWKSRGDSNLVGNLPLLIWALLIYPAKSNFFVRLQIFLHAGCNVLPPEELTPHAKNYECGYWCLQRSRNSSQLAFLGNFCTNNQKQFQSKLHNIQFCSMEKTICSLRKKNFTLMKIFCSMLKFNLHILQGR